MHTFSKKRKKMKEEEKDGEEMLLLKASYVLPIIDSINMFSTNHAFKLK
jgi:hypothetical protein